jgi:hypothetical protein
MDVNGRIMTHQISELGESTVGTSTPGFSL